MTGGEDAADVRVTLPGGYGVRLLLHLYAVADIPGQGAIDGNVYAFMKRVSPYYFNGDFYPHPTMCYVEHCNHITFTGITMKNSLAVR